MSRAIDEGFPLRKRIDDTQPSRAPHWATEVKDVDEGSWMCRTYVEAPPFDPIEIAQWAEENEDGRWDIYEPAAEITESGVGDPAVCEAIADAIDRGDHEQIEHFLLWNDPLDDGRNAAALVAYSRALRECASVLRVINPNREQDYPTEYMWIE